MGFGLAQRQRKTKRESCVFRVLILLIKIICVVWLINLISRYDYGSNAFFIIVIFMGEIR